MIEPESTIGCVLMRHAESEDVVAGLVSGQRDIPLTERGKDQARDAAWRLAALGVRSVVSSDLCRARDTANLIVQQLGLPEPWLDPRLRERHWGTWQGQARTGNSNLADEEAPPGGESLLEMRDRVLLALAGLPPRTLVVTHAGPIRETLRQLDREPLTPAPGEWIDLQPPPSDEEEGVQVVAEIFSPGEFSGKAIYVSSAEDLARVCADSLVLLCNCPKAIAVEAMDKARATVNLTRSLTAHLIHGRVSAQPYAVALGWPAGYPRGGCRVRLDLEAPKRQILGTLLTDVPPKGHPTSETEGGKAAGLHILCAAGAFVPPFHTIGFAELERWRQSQSIRNAARPWVSEIELDKDCLWAVRSSADVEDTEADPMSGSFASILGRRRDEVPEAIESVADSANSPEILSRLQKGRLHAMPRMAVIVQRMVAPARMAGTVFLPARGNPSCCLVEARWGNTGEKMMDGQAQPDVSVRCDLDGSRIEINRLALDVADHPVAVELCARVAREALALYRETGRGDLEFAVDSANRVWWLQARVLNEPVEVIDRRGFHPAALAYYKLLAFRVAEANCVDRSFFRCFDLADGLFGYSVGIRQRDGVFHDRIQRDAEHLAKVTAFGWEIEKRMAETVASLEGYNPAEVLDLLTLHGAVQLPFSIPMNTVRMDRYQSTPIDGHPSRMLLEDLVARVSDRLWSRPPAGEIINLLFQPVRTLSTLERQQALLGLLHTKGEPEEADLLQVRLRELRDVRSVSQLRAEALSEVAKHREADPDGNTLAGDIERQEQSYAESRGRRAEFLATASRSLDDELNHQLRLWANYLEMKAETNETHCLYRGTCFVWFGRKDFRPGPAFVQHRISELCLSPEVSAPEGTPSSALRSESVG